MSLVFKGIAKAILHIRLYEQFLKQIKKIYSSVTKGAKQSFIFAARTFFVLVLGRVILVLCHIVLVLLCVLLMLYLCCVLFSRVVPVLSFFLNPLDSNTAIHYSNRRHTKIAVFEKKNRILIPEKF